MGVFFSDQGEAAVCARVAIALVKLERRRRAPDELKPTILIGCTVERLKGLHLLTVRLALLSLSVWVSQGRHSDAWLKGVLMRDYYGFSIRRCYYAEYKANRGDDPRVTNRGVMHQLPLPDGADFPRSTQNEPSVQ
jgi:hypothetical protein